jgi:3-oxoacyl-[acyl-carrier-protein] synthase-1
MSLCITGYGAVTAVGSGAAQTAAAVRAGIARFREHPYHYAQADPPYAGEPERLACAPVAFLDALDREPDRLLRLALAPLAELVEQARLGRDDLAGAGLFLAARPPLAGLPEWGLDDGLLPELVRRAALRPFAAARLVRGATGFFQALALAAEAIAGGACRGALVGGVDSWLDEASVLHFDAAGRLKSARNRDGFIGGEAAALVWLETPERARQRGVPSLGTVVATPRAHEARPLAGDRQSSGEALTAVLRAALAVVGAAPFWVIADLNGESYRAFEWGVTQARLGRAVAGLRGLWHPADCLGDVRAAAPPVHLVLACEAFRKRYAPAPHALLFAGEDDGERAGAVVRGAEG